MTTPKPVCLCILDGFGIREERENNAVKLAEPSGCRTDRWAIRR
jgi:bisphosphoglycerate-independent phosphoglycerate mutase (AlkP superfamily)